MATRIRIKRGTESQITGYTGTQYEGELAYATNTGEVFVNNGTQFITVGRSSETPTLQSVTDAGNTTTNSIGIGTATPGYPLHIVTSNNSTVLGLDAGSAARFRFAGNSTSGYTSTFNIDDTGLDIGHDSTARSLNLKTGNQDRLTILGAGNVGIGTTAPTEKLEVVGNIISTWNNNRFIGIQFENGDAFKNGLVLKAGDRSTGLISKASNNNPYIWFGTGSEPVTERMRITDTGNVGINTATPTQKLDVIGNIKANNLFVESDIYHQGDPDTKFSFTNNSIQLHTFGNERLRITQDGNVGIGTTAPTEKLEVNGTILQSVVGYAPNDDLNDVVGTRFFRSHSSSTNAPVPNFGMGINIQFQNDSALQIMSDRSGANPFYVRKQSNGNWSNWIKLRDENQISDTDIDNWDTAYSFWVGTYGTNNDWNTIDSNSFIRGHTTAINYPPDLNRSFLSGIAAMYSSTNGWQLASDRNGESTLYFRKVSNGTWQTWRKIWSTTDFDQTNIDNWDAGYSNWTGTYGTNNDWNNVNTNAFIKGHTTTLNYPPELPQSFLSGLSVLYGANNGWQIASDRSSNSNLYFRHVSNGTWFGWKRILDADDIYVDNSNGNVGIGTTTPNSKVNISGTAMQQLRMETAGGPSSAGDTNGRIGDMAYDDDFFYIKTANGWGRLPLDFGF